MAVATARQHEFIYRLLEGLMKMCGCKSQSFWPLLCDCYCHRASLL